DLKASSVLTKPSTGMKVATGKKGWRLAGQHRAGIHCSIAIDGVRDAYQEADYATDTSTDDIALWCRRSDPGDIAGAGHLAQHGARVSGSDRCSGDHLAAAGRSHRPGAGTAIVRQWWRACRSTPLRGARLGGGRAGAEAPGREPDGPMGRISGCSR